MDEQGIQSMEEYQYMQNRFMDRDNYKDLKKKKNNKIIKW